MRSAARYSLLVRDWIRFSPAALRVYSWAIETRERWGRPQGADRIARRLSRLAKAARAGTGVRDVARLEAGLRHWAGHWTADGFAWESWFPDTGSNRVRKALILKAPRAGQEKGVLFVAFETQWIRLLRHANLPALARDYELVLSPTWSPPHDLALLIAAKLWPGAVYCLLSNFSDEATFARLAPSLRPIPLLASSWVNPDLVAPAPTESKAFDIAMLANFSIYKRHFALFHALAQMKHPRRVLLLGGPWEGRTRATLEREASLFGVADRVTIRESLPDEDMFAALRSAKVMVIMSLVEGSCVAVAESLFAGVPVGLLDTARVGSSAFINPETGRRLSPRSLAAELERFVDEAAGLRPREWALEHGIGCGESSQRLNAALRAAARSEGLPWTADLVPMHWRPNARYLQASDAVAFRDLYAQFPGRYGVAIEV